MMFSNGIKLKSSVCVCTYVRCSRRFSYKPSALFWILHTNHCLWLSMSDSESLNPPFPPLIAFPPWQLKHQMIYCEIGLFRSHSYLFLLISLFIYLFVCLLCVWVFGLCMSLITCMPGAHRSQKRLLNTLKTGVTDICEWLCRTQSWVLWKSNQYSLSHLSSPSSLIIKTCARCDQCHVCCLVSVQCSLSADCLTQWWRSNPEWWKFRPKRIKVSKANCTWMLVLKSITNPKLQSPLMKLLFLWSDISLLLCLRCSWL